MVCRKPGTGREQLENRDTNTLSCSVLQRQVACECLAVAAWRSSPWRTASRATSPMPTSSPAEAAAARAVRAAPLGARRCEKKVAA